MSIQLSILSVKIKLKTFFPIIRGTFEFASLSFYFIYFFFYSFIKSGCTLTEPEKKKKNPNPAVVRLFTNTITVHWLSFKPSTVTPS